MPIDDAIDEVRDRAADLLNAEGRSMGHVMIGVVTPPHAHAG